MIINHEDVRKGRVLFKGRSIKTWAQRDSNATRGNLMQITQYQQKKNPNCVSASLQLHLYPFRPNSLKLFIISYPSHQHLAAHSDCSPHSWPRWWHCLSFRPPFACNHSCFIITLFDKPFVFFYGLQGRPPAGTWTAPDREGNVSDVMRIHLKTEAR